MGRGNEVGGDEARGEEGEKKGTTKVRRTQRK
jgi:hypothetical protein